MLLDWLLALFPILLILLLMIRFRWGAAKAGPAGWFAALCIAVVRFGAGLEVLAVAQAKSLFFSLDVLMITWAAFLLYRVVDEGGAIQVLKEALFRLTADPGSQALLIAWAFASFLQGVGGYGVPVAVTAPIMIGLGFSPVVVDFGEPDEVVEDAKYEQSTAFWVSYRGWGIAFRVLLMENQSTLIQAIAVFPGTARSNARRGVLVPPLLWSER